MTLFVALSVSLSVILVSVSMDTFFKQRKYKKFYTLTLKQIDDNWHEYFQGNLSKKQLIDFNLSLSYRVIDYKMKHHTKADINYDELIEYCILSFGNRKKNS